MPKHAGAYKSDKRKKELSRLKKQEEKRQRRLQKDAGQKNDAELTVPECEDQEKEQQSS